MTFFFWETCKNNGKWYASWKMVWPTFNSLSKFWLGLGPTYVKPDHKANHKHKRVYSDTLHILRQNRLSTSPTPDIVTYRFKGSHQVSWYYCETYPAEPKISCGCYPPSTCNLLIPRDWAPDIVWIIVLLLLTHKMIITKNIMQFDFQMLISQHMVFTFILFYLKRTYIFIIWKTVINYKWEGKIY